ncbi:MAG TPA: 2-(1,2-epoxy-1,2-dihydrophenyl)acetyl-CoA isomerase [Candidatus Marinimicrobia bacterium]|jgi:2-(1,2-epoxy-1,2-dihydrophenyl)acetyl-CoA isomerase|nr:2-(1,2-epoxy-1,2-dihydrophenyl)acetyl-CoA isomerase [Candidatus Neomarinimicrobiota bacterium]
MILFEKIDAIGKTTLNRPEKYNSFVREMALALQNILNDCANDDSIRCILITGSGKAFCAGQDLKEATDPEGPEIEQIVREHYNPIIRKIREIEKPVIAAVNGIAAGAGANVALACDIVVAGKSANFIQAFSKIGLIPDSGGTYFLPRLIGLPKATALMMTGESISAEKAEKMGMIYAVYEDTEFESKSLQLAKSISEMPTKGLGYTKRLLTHSLNNSLDEQLDLEAETQALSAKSEDHKEGVQAFLEKRPPVFTGK